MTYEEFWDIIHPARKNPKPLPTSTCEVDEEWVKRWKLNGVLHRVDGPAVECPNGIRYWRLNGVLHREDGPAVEYPDGYREWWVNGVFQVREDGSLDT